MKRKVKQIDPYLKSKIGEARLTLMNLEKPSNKVGTQRVYYTGNFQEDVLNNYTEKQSQKIFKEFAKFRETLDFFQAKIKPFTDSEGEVFSGYDYIAVKK